MPRNNYRERPLTKFFSNSISGSILIIVATLLAIICANVPGISDVYHWFCNIKISVFLGSFDLFMSPEGNMTVARFVNDALMAVFFFSVGLEIKREILIGELSNIKHALLPIIGALGGMIAPVLIFFFVSKGTPAAGGVAIPMATDIAFSLAVLSLFGSRVSLGLKVFLTALAVADDLAGIIVIALFYSHGVEYIYLLISLVLMIVLYMGGRSGINNKVFYLSIGVVLWFMFYYAGVHSTIAGVVTAFFIPARPKISSYKFIAKLKSSINRFPPVTLMSKGVVILNKDQRNIIHKVNVATDKVISPLQKMENFLHPVIGFAIIPIFAFINAGIVFDGVTVDTFTSITTIGVFFGLVLGKFIGIFLFASMAIKLKLALIPSGVNFKQLAAVSMLGGIGFTVSLFIANLSFEGIPVIGHTLLNEAKIGIVLASVVAGTLGYIMLNVTLPKTK